MSWTKFYDFNEVLEIKPFADEKGRATSWMCSFNGKMVKFQTRDGCVLKDKGKLDTHDCGIYWLRVNQTCKTHSSGYWDYIGLSDNRDSEKYQRGIYGRLADHIRKIQYIPHRSKFKYRLYNKDHDDGKSDWKIKKEKLITPAIEEKYLSRFKDKDFKDCQDFRDYFLTNNGEDLIEKDCSHEYAKLFSFNKKHLKTFDEIKKFMETNIQIRFFVIPKMSQDKPEKLYIEIAEALCFDAYKKKNNGEIPRLNDRDESKKLPWNGGNTFRKQDIQYVQEEINILNGLFL